MALNQISEQELNQYLDECFDAEKRRKAYHEVNLWDLVKDNTICAGFLFSPFWFRASHQYLHARIMAMEDKWKRIPTYCFILPYIIFVVLDAAQSLLTILFVSGMSCACASNIVGTNEIMTAARSYNAAEAASQAALQGTDKQPRENDSLWQTVLCGLLCVICYWYYLIVTVMSAILAVMFCFPVVLMCKHCVSSDRHHPVPTKEVGTEDNFEDNNRPYDIYDAIADYAKIRVDAVVGAERTRLEAKLAEDADGIIADLEALEANTSKEKFTPEQREFTLNEFRKTIAENLLVLQISEGIRMKTEVTRIMKLPPTDPEYVAMDQEVAEIFAAHKV